MWGSGATSSCESQFKEVEKTRALLEEALGPSTPSSDQQKICTACNTLKSITQFYSNLKNKDGKNDMCRKCQRDTTQKAKIAEHLAIPLLLDSSQQSHDDWFIKDTNGMLKITKDRYAQVAVKEKKCSRCKKVKPKKLFFPSNHTEDNLGELCRKCVKESNKIVRENSHLGKRDTPGKESNKIVRENSHLGKRDTPDSKNLLQTVKEEVNVKHKDANGEQPFHECVNCGARKPLKMFYKRIVEETDKATYMCRSCTKIEAKRRKLMTISENQDRTKTEDRTKICARCSICKSVAQFYSSKKSSDGFTSYCRSCFKDIKRQQPTLMPETTTTPFQVSDVDQSPKLLGQGQESIDCTYKELHDLILQYPYQYEVEDDIDWSVLHLQGYPHPFGFNIEGSDLVDVCIGSNLDAFDEDNKVENISCSQARVKQLENVVENGFVKEDNLCGQPKFKRQNQAVLATI